MTNHKLLGLFRELIAREYTDNYKVGVQFFFNLRHLEKLAGERHVQDNRSPEDDGINRIGGFNTVPDLDFPELEYFLWKHIEPTIKKNNVTFISTCLALTYKPNYRRVNMHLHREALREVNPSSLNYTFFLCTEDQSKVSFNVVDHPIPREDIFEHKLIDYVHVGALREYIQDRPVVSYELQHGDVMRFDATKIAHGAFEMFDGDEIGAYLVLNGCADALPHDYHQVFKRL